MDATKLLTILCCFALVVCLTISIVTLTVLRNAVAENAVVQEEARAVVGELDVFADELSGLLKEDSVNTSASPDAPAVESYLLRISNGRIGIFTADGRLITLTDIKVDLFPAADRELLAKGIPVSDLSELIERIADYQN